MTYGIPQVSVEITTKGILLLTKSDNLPKIGPKKVASRFDILCIHPRIPAEAPIVSAIIETKG